MPPPALTGFRAARIVPRMDSPSVAGELAIPTRLSAAIADWSRALAYVDGQWCALDEARIPIRDYGLMRADLTYEVVHVWRGGFFRLDDHLDRFADSCRGFRLDPGMSRAELAALLHRLVARSGLRDASVWWAVTRGAPPLGSRDPAMARNAVYAYAQPLVPRVDAARMRRGMHAMIHRTVRRIPPDSVNPRHKNTHWADMTVAEFDARDAGFDIAILLDREGNVTETAGANVGAIVEGRLVMPDGGCLGGISAMTMVEIANDLGIPAGFAPIPAEMLADADEAFMTGTTNGLVPITRIDQRILGNSAPGPLTTRIYNEYIRRKNAGWHITPIDYGGTVP